MDQRHPHDTHPPRLPSSRLADLLAELAWLEDLRGEAEAAAAPLVGPITERARPWSLALDALEHARQTLDLKPVRP